MEIQEILKALEYDTGTFPLEALNAAIENQTEVIPGLLRFLSYARENAESLRKPQGMPYIGHINAMFLLAQFREPRACKAITDFFESLHDETLDDLTGDMMTEDLYRIFASVAGNDDSPIRVLVENEMAYEYVRGAAVLSYVTMVMTGLRNREEVIDYYSHLFKGSLRRKPSQVWNELVSCTTELNPRELYDEILKARDERLFDNGFITFKTIEREKKKTVEQSLKQLSSFGGVHTLITDAISELQAKHLWSLRSDGDDSYEFEDDFHIDLEDSFTDNFEDEEESEIIPVRTEPKTGRNEPCPCGSGKKYKKCCGAP